MSQFSRFPELPKEIQEEIWQYASIVIPEADTRIHRIAPSPSWQYTRSSADEVWFTVMPQNSTPVPSLLHVCKHSRDVALLVYELWPCGDIDDKYQRTRIRAFVYVHNKCDIFYFGQREGGNTDASDYWFLLNLCTSRTQYGDLSAIAARARFKEITASIRHWAFDCTIWDTRTEPSFTRRAHIPHWYKTIFRAKSITVVLGNTPTQHTKLDFVPVSPSTSGVVRRRVAEKVRKELEFDLDKVRLVSPKLHIPDFRIMQFTNSTEHDYMDSLEEVDLSDASLLVEWREFVGTCDIRPGAGWELSE